MIRSILFFLVLISLSKTKAQDIHFSQFYTSPLLLNPAAAGAYSDYRLSINYKNQWKSVINPFKTAAISFDTKLFKKDSSQNCFGIGISLFNDQAGISKLVTNQANLSMAYHLGVGEKSRLSLGVQSGFFQKYININGLRWDNQYNGKDYDGSRPTGENLNVTNYNDFDLGAGILYSQNISARNSWKAGASVSHLNRPNNSFYQEKRQFQYRYTAHAEFAIQPEDKNYTLFPSLLGSMQGGHLEVVGGGNIGFALNGKDTGLKKNKAVYNSIRFGAFYRLQDAVIFSAALQCSQNMLFGMSYDFNVSKLNSASKFRGGPEFSFVYSGFTKKKQKPVFKKDSLHPIAKSDKAEFKGTVLGKDKPVPAGISVTAYKPGDVGKNRAKPTQYFISDPLDGKFDIRLETGYVYEVKILADGFEPYTEMLDLSDQGKKNDTERTFQLTAEKPSVAAYSGKVQGEDGPLSSRITISALDDKGNPVPGSEKTYTSDANGNYQFNLPKGKKYKVQVNAEGYETHEEIADHSALEKYKEEQKDFTLKKQSVRKEEISPCTGKPFPDLSVIKTTELKFADKYQKMLELLSDACLNGMTFKIQIAAVPKNHPYHPKHLGKFGEPEKMELADGLMHYTLGEFKTINEAEDFRQKLLAAGQKDAWIVVFVDGKRLTLEQWVRSRSKKPGE